MSGRRQAQLWCRGAVKVSPSNSPEWGGRPPSLAGTRWRKISQSPGSPDPPSPTKDDSEDMLEKGPACGRGVAAVDDCGALIVVPSPIKAAPLGEVRDAAAGDKQSACRYAPSHPAVLACGFGPASSDCGYILTFDRDIAPAIVRSPMAVDRAAGPASAGVVALVQAARSGRPGRPARTPQAGSGRAIREQHQARRAAAHNRRRRRWSAGGRPARGALGVELGDRPSRAHNDPIGDRQLRP